MKFYIALHIDKYGRVFAGKEADERLRLYKTDKMPIPADENSMFIEIPFPAEWQDRILNGAFYEKKIGLKEKMLLSQMELRGLELNDEEVRKIL